MYRLSHWYEIVFFKANENYTCNNIILYYIISVKYIFIKLDKLNNMSASYSVVRVIH